MQLVRPATPTHKAYTRPIQEADVKNFTFGIPKPNFRNQVSVPLYSQVPAKDPVEDDSGLQHLVVALPPLYVAFNPSAFQGTNNISLELDFKSAVINSATRDALRVLQQLDQLAQAQLVGNRDALLPHYKRTGPSAKTDFQCSQVYVPTTRLRTSASSDRCWAPRLSCATHGAKILSRLPIAPRVSIDKLVQRGDIVQVVIACNGLSIRGDKASLTWRAMQIRLVEAETLPEDISISEKEAFGANLADHPDAEGPSVIQSFSEDLI